MNLGLEYADELPPIVRDELEQLIAAIQTALNGLEAGSGATAGSRSGVAFPGPLVLKDGFYAESPGLLHVTLATSQNNYAPAGLATASVLLINPTVASLSLTGLQSPANQGNLNTHRFLYLVNVGSYSFTLVGSSASSLGPNQFALALNPTATTVTIRPNEGYWLFWNTQWLVMAAAQAATTLTIPQVTNLVTLGNLTTGQATNVVTLSDGNTPLFTASVDIGNAAIGTLFSSPVQVIAAPAAGQVARLYDVTLRGVVGTGWGSNPNVSLVYSGDTTAIAGGGTALQLGTAGFDKFYVLPELNHGNFNTTIANGKAIDIRLASDPAGAGTGCTLSVRARYGLVSV